MNPNYAQPQNGQVDLPQQHATSPYGQHAAPFDYGNSQPQDNSPVDLMSMNHSIVSDGGVDPALGGMTFSPGLTYTETLQYPGPFSLNYYYAQYGGPGDASGQADPTQHQQHMSQATNNQSPGMQSMSSPRTDVSNANMLFGPAPPQNPDTNGAPPNAWDQGFQIPFSPNYSFNFGNAMTDQIQGNANGGLGVVHPPMLPWFAESVSAKQEPEHDISFGQH